MLSLVTTFFSNLPLFFVTAIMRQSPAQRVNEIDHLKAGSGDPSLFLKLVEPVSSDWTRDYNPLPWGFSPQHIYFLILFWCCVIGLLWMTFSPSKGRRQTIPSQHAQAT